MPTEEVCVAKRIRKGKWKGMGVTSNVMEMSENDMLDEETGGVKDKDQRISIHVFPSGGVTVTFFRCSLIW